MVEFRAFLVMNIFDYAIVTCVVLRISVLLCQRFIVILIWGNLLIVL